MFARLISIAQITWIVLQTIVRAAKGLAISQLEIAVLAFSTCAIVIYSLNWSKPKGVKTPYFILSYDEEIPLNVRDEIQDAGVYDEGLIYAFLGVGGQYSSYSSCIPNDCNVINDDQSNDSGFFGIIIGSIIFGGIHVAAWNFDFPTENEQLVWRVTSLWCMLIYFFFILLGALLSCISGSIFDRVIGMFTRIVSVLYVLARLFLLVEVFRTLCFLPPDAYISTWATNFPHLA